jgi:hypothetical protein
VIGEVDKVALAAARVMPSGACVGGKEG